MNNKDQNFNQILDGFATEALRVCGLSHDVYVQSFSRQVDKFVLTLAKDSQAFFMALATEESYATPSEIEAMETDNKANGRCTHGLDPNCCPCGCGEYSELDELEEENMVTPHYDFEEPYYVGQTVGVYESLTGEETVRLTIVGIDDTKIITSDGEAWPLTGEVVFSHGSQPCDFETCNLIPFD